MRYAISYCAMRVSISGSPYACAVIWFSFAMASSMRRRVALSMPGGSAR